MHEKQYVDLSQMQMSEQAFWLSDPTRNMADPSEQYKARDGKWKWLFRLYSIGRVDDACFCGEKVLMIGK